MNKNFISLKSRLEDYIKSGAVKEFIPNLVYLHEGTHFAHEQSPDEVNQLILTCAIILEMMKVISCWPL